MDYWIIIGLSETRRRGEQLEQLQSGHVLYTRGGEESIGGVGFMVNKSIKDRVVQYEGINSRVALITIKINKKYKDTSGTSVFTNIQPQRR